VSGSGIDWEAFFATYRPLALRIATGLVGDPASAEDVLQEAAGELFERAERKGLALASAEHARNYFLRAVRTRAVSRLRRGARDPGEPAAPAAERPASAEADPLERIARRESREERARLARRLEEALEGLRSEEASAIRLRYGEALGFREMAERTGLPISTLHARVEAGLAKLRRRLGKPRDGA